MILSNSVLRLLVAALVGSPLLLVPIVGSAQIIRAPKDVVQKTMKEPERYARKKSKKDREEAARQALLEQAKAFFAAEKMESGKVIVVARDEKKRSAKGKEVAGVTGVRTIGKRRIEERDLQGANRVAVFEKQEDGTITAYRVNAVRALPPKTNGKDKKKNGPAGGPARTDSSGEASASESGGMIHGESSYTPEVVVVEEIVIEVDESTIASTDEEGSAGDAPPPCFRLGICDEDGKKLGEPRVVVGNDDFTIAEIELEKVEDPAEAEAWKEIVIETEAGCRKPVAGERTWFSARGDSESVCE